MLPGIDFSMVGLDRPPIALVASVVDTTDRSGSYPFAGLNFGDDFTNRTLVAVPLLVRSASTLAQLNQTSVTIGGASATGDDNGNTGNGSPNGGAGVGVWSAQPAGTSGTVVVNVDTGGVAASACALYLFSVAGLSSPTAYAQTTGLNTTGTTDSQGLNIPTDGVIIGGIARANNTNSISLIGFTRYFDLTLDGSHRIAVGYDVRMPAQVGRTVGYSSTGSSIIGGRVASFG